MSEHRNHISFYQREEIDLKRISEDDLENLNSAKELMLVEQVRKKEIKRVKKKNNLLKEAELEAMKKL